MPRKKPTRERAAARTTQEPPAARIGRPPKGLVGVTLRLTPEQHQVLTQSALRAKLEGKPNADDGASGLVRQLVQTWIDKGAKWPTD